MVEDVEVGSMGEGGSCKFVLDATTSGGLSFETAWIYAYPNLETTGGTTDMDEEVEVGGVGGVFIAMLFATNGDTSEKAATVGSRSGLDG